jgi:hypothetical protein
MRRRSSCPQQTGRRVGIVKQSLPSMPFYADKLSFSPGRHGREREREKKLISIVRKRLSTRKKREKAGYQHSKRRLLSQHGRMVS